MFNRIFKNRIDPPFSILIILSFLVHATVLGILIFIPSKGATSNISNEYVVQQVNLVSPESLPGETPVGKPTRLKPRAIPLKKVDMQEAIMVAPSPAADPLTRWIVELTNSNGEEPEQANFVAERPSRVVEEIRAEQTGQKPKPRKGAQRQRGAKIDQQTVEEQPRNIRKPRHSEQIVSARIPPQMASRTAPPPPPAPKAPEPASQAPATNNGNAPAPPVPQPPSASNGAGQEIARKQPSGRGNLYPSLGELARKTPGQGGSGERRLEGEEGDGENENGIAGAPQQAPENFIPMVKKRGPITLLNAKSYTFAAFVRRVAYRIFDRFVLGFEPRHYGGGDWDAMKRGATYEAVMNRTGNAVNIVQHRSSGSDEFNALVKRSLEKGAWDTNVPDGVECADGFVHFIFIPKIIPSQETAAPNGSRGYSNFYLMAVAGLKDCD